MLGSDFSLVDCAYCPILNVVEKAGFFGDFPRSQRLSRSDAFTPDLEGHAQAPDVVDEVITRQAASARPRRARPGARRGRFRASRAAPPPGRAGFSAIYLRPFGAFEYWS